MSIIGKRHTIILSTITILSGCSSHNGTCYSDECGSGYNEVSSSEQPIVTGEYESGRLIKGKVIYPGIKPSSFEGEFQWLNNPYYDTEPFKVPKYGTYTSIFGEQFTGRYQYVHRPGSEAITEARHNGIEGAYGALFMVGEKIDREGSKTLGVWHADYRSDKFISGLSPSSVGYIKHTIEQSETNNRREKRKWQQDQFSWDDFFSGAAEVLVYAGEVSRQYQQSSSNTSVVTTPLPIVSPQKTPSSSSNMKVASVERGESNNASQVLNKPSISSTQSVSIQKSQKTIKTPSKSKTSQTQRVATKPVKDKAKKNTIMIKKPFEVFGQTPMYYKYALALDLARVNASNNAARMCRQNGGRQSYEKSERVGYMLQKDCKKLPSDDTQYKCKVKMNFDCYFKTTNITN